jgi:hypothetical protein
MDWLTPSHRRLLETIKAEKEEAFLKSIAPPRKTVEVRIFPCGACGGDGGHEGFEGGQWERCLLCDGTGEFEVELQEIEAEDLTMREEG